MRNIFSQLFEAAKTEEKLIAIHTNTEDHSRFAVGYIQEYDDTMIYLKSVDPESNDDGYLYIRVEDIHQVGGHDRYLNDLQFLRRTQAALAIPLCTVERQQGGNYLISLMKQAMADHLILSINSIYDYWLTGYVEDIDDRYLQLHVITDEGYDDGIAAIRLEEIERVRIAGKEEKISELLFNYRSVL